jgi:hypothetical protein
VDKFVDQAHYIIFHPDKARQAIDARATSIENGQVHTTWEGKVCVDSINNGNEDPFVFSDPWLYSYCHATQLRRTPREDGNYLQKDSVIFFVSGDCANKRHLTIDTVFVIGNIHAWTKKPNLALPTKYHTHFKNDQSTLWHRHLRFPFCGQHDSVTHTYEAKHYTDQDTEVEAPFSFLPIDKDGDRFTIPFDQLPTVLAAKIKDKNYGKYPVLLSCDEMQQIYQLIETEAVTKVIGNISCELKPIEKEGTECKNCGT